MSGLSFEAPPTDADKASYNRLPAADRALIDRAIFNDITDRQGNNYVFSQAERNRRGNEITSKEVEWDIWKMRAQEAERFRGNNAQDATVRQDLTRRGTNAPQNATGMLNAIIAYNGDECGCTIGEAPAITTPMLNRIITNGQGR